MIAPDLVQLVLHGLACWPVRGPENLFDRAYVAHVHGVAPQTLEHLAADAPLAAQLWTTGHRPLQLLFLLHPDLSHFMATAPQPLAELSVGSAARLHAALCALEPTLVEVLRADLALDAEAWHRWYCAGAAERDAAWAEVAPWLERVRALVPSVGSVEGVLSLGRRGRVIGDRILVGIPVPWMEVDPIFPAITAGHEACVRAAGGDYVAAETGALIDLAAYLEPDTELCAAHARWLDGLDLLPLAEEAVSRGLLTPEEAGLLAGNPLAALRSAGRRQAGTFGPRAGT